MKPLTVSLLCHSAEMHDAAPAAPPEGNDLEAKTFLEPLAPKRRGVSGTVIAVVVDRYAVSRAGGLWPPAFFC